VVKGKAQLAEAGRTLLAPKGVPHTHRVDSSESAHVLPPISAPTPLRLLTCLCAKGNIEIVGPPRP
jgi:hypothetical protein